LKYFSSFLHAYPLHLSAFPQAFFEQKLITEEIRAAVPETISGWILASPSKKFNKT
jgi:hypothetical protein